MKPEDASTNTPPARPSYTTFVVERQIAAPRQRVWDEMVSLVGDGVRAGATKTFRLDDRELVEQTLSFEPPWRRCYELISGSPLAFYQGTTTIRDDGDRCLLVWSFLTDPGPDPDAEDFLDRVRLALTRAVDSIADAAISPMP